MAHDVEPGFRSLGQASARRAVLQAAGQRRLGSTLLVHGPPGSGKGAFVDDLLALLFCADGEPVRRPCNACRGCRDARSRAHPDLVIGSPDAWREARGAGESIVAAARRWLLDAAGAPVTADRRVVLIERADRASEQIQNALLKALEEPSDRHIFVLVADEPGRLLPTIRSRSQALRIGPVPREELVQHLMDVERLPSDLADALATVSGGRAGIAIGFARDKPRLEWRRRIQLALLEALGRRRADRFAMVRDLLDDAVAVAGSAPDPGDEEARTPASVQRDAALRLVEAWLACARDLLVAAAGRPALAPGAELSDGLAETARRIGVPPLLAAVDRLERVHAGLRENGAPKLALEAAMLAWPMLPARTDR